MHGMKFEAVRFESRHVKGTGLQANALISTWMIVYTYTKLRIIHFITSFPVNYCLMKQS